MTGTVSVLLCSQWLHGSLCTIRYTFVHMVVCGCYGVLVLCAHVCVCCVCVRVFVCVCFVSLSLSLSLSLSVCICMCMFVHTYVCSCVCLMHLCQPMLPGDVHFCVFCICAKLSNMEDY